MAITVKQGVIWDVETTGLDHETCDIIELGTIKFEWEEEETATGLRIGEPRIITMYGGLRDPGKPIPPEITRITGITDADVKGKSLSGNALLAFTQGIDIHIAHNASFDKSFLMKCHFFSGIENPRWACTIKHIDWVEKGFKSTSLNYLACDQGFVNPFPHRALFDCATTFRLMKPHFQELLLNHVLKLVRIYAWGSSVTTKDLLKERKYFWDPEKRVWKKECIESKLPQEIAFLNESVYGHPNNGHEVEVIVM